MGIIIRGIRIYMVTAELNEAEIFKPSIFANAAVEKSANQYIKYISLIPKIVFAIITNRKD